MLNLTSLNQRINYLLTEINKKIENPLTSDLDANGFDILNVNNIDLTTINSNPYPPVVPTDDLDATLTAGNSAGANDIDMNNNDIINIKELELNGTSTITDATGDLVVQPPLNQTLQLGNNIYIDTNTNRVGINVPIPTEDLEIDGNIQMNTGATSKIVFYDQPNAHEHGEIDAEGDGVNGGALKFQTKVDGGGVTEKFRINNTGAIGLSGANYGTSGQTIVSNGSSAPTWEFPPDRKNYLMNGNFDIWQRGTSFLNQPNDVKFADRWQSEWSGATHSITQGIFTTGQTDVPNNPNYYANVEITVADNLFRVGQRIENVYTVAGEEVTLSFYAKYTTTAPTSFSVESRQDFGSGGSADLYTNIATNQTLTTSWQKFTYTFTPPSLSGKTVGADSYLMIYPIWIPLSELCDFQLAQVQLERGSYATNFEYYFLAKELQLCKRYFENYSSGYTGWNISATQTRFGTNWMVEKRVAPTGFSFVSGFCQYGPGGQQNFTNITLESGSGTQAGLFQGTLSGGLTTNAGSVGVFNVLVDAEL